MCTAVIIAKLTFKIRNQHNWRSCISKSLEQELWGVVAIYHLKLSALEPDWGVNVSKMLFFSWYTKTDIQWPADTCGFTTGSTWVCTTDTPFSALLWITYAFMLQHKITKAQGFRTSQHLGYEIHTSEGEWGFYFRFPCRLWVPCHTSQGRACDSYCHHATLFFRHNLGRGRKEGNRRLCCCVAGK